MGYAEAIDQQMAALRWWRGPHGLEMAAFIRKRMKITELDSEEFRRHIAAMLLDAEPFSVAGHICELIEVGGDALPPYPLIADTLPCPRGWVYFDHPLRMDRENTLRAFCWELNESGANIGVFAEIPEMGVPTLAAVEAWMVGESWDWRTQERSDVDNRILRYFASLVAFMKQRLLVTSSRAITNRQARRRLARVIEHIPEVRVVELRARDYQQRDESEDHHVEYSCRWLVRGHWHLYHTREGLQPRWVMPYVKGPTDKPLRVAEKVAYEVVR